MFSSNVGMVHTLCAVIAIIAGALVIWLPKGTLLHKKFGYLFVTAMILMNGTALFTQSIYSFGPFHWMAIGSMLFVMLGLSAPVFLRKIRIGYEFIMILCCGLMWGSSQQCSQKLP